MIKLKSNEISISVILSVFIVLSIFAAYSQVLNYDFVNFDDNEYVTENEFVKKGITVDSIVWAFSHFQTAKWHPLTWVSHMMDYQFFGLDAGLHHLTNLIFHILNSSLLFFVFKTMTGKLWQSAVLSPPSLLFTHCMWNPLHGFQNVKMY